MGFDDYECLKCYLEGGGNNPCEESEANVCFGCIDKYAREGGEYVPHHRVASALSDGWSCTIEWDCLCNMCQRQSALCYNVCICEICKQEALDEAVDKALEQLKSKFLLCLEQIRMVETHI